MPAHLPETCVSREQRRLGPVEATRREGTARTGPPGPRSLSSTRSASLELAPIGRYRGDPPSSAPARDASARPAPPADRATRNCPRGRARPERAPEHARAAAPATTSASQPAGSDRDKFRSPTSGVGAGRPQHRKPLLARARWPARPCARARSRSLVPRAGAAHRAPLSGDRHGVITSRTSTPGPTRRRTARAGLPSTTPRIQLRRTKSITIARASRRLARYAIVFSG